MGYSEAQATLSGTCCRQPPWQASLYLFSGSNNNKNKNKDEEDCQQQQAARAADICAWLRLLAVALLSSSSPLPPPSFECHFCPCGLRHFNFNLMQATNKQIKCPNAPYEYERVETSSTREREEGGDEAWQPAQSTGVAI